jgi:hypothetical protein
MGFSPCLPFQFRLLLRVLRILLQDTSTFPNPILFAGAAPHRSHGEQQ